MADLKISQLTGSTTPLAGTEVLPVVQGGTTKQVSVANLTAGRAVSAASLALSGTPLPITSGGTATTNPPAFGATLTANQSLANGVWTKLEMATELFDTNNNYDPTTNYRFTPTVAGYYQFNVVVQVGTTTFPAGAAIYKNGASAGYSLGSFQAAALFAQASFSTILLMNGTTDYIEAFAIQVSGGPVSAVSGVTGFNGCFLRG
jgi:hypothetical protein